MTSAEYEDMEKAEPDLRLPPWFWIDAEEQRRILSMTSAEVRGERILRLMCLDDDDEDFNNFMDDRVFLA